MRRKSDLVNCRRIPRPHIGIIFAICASLALLNACQYPTPPLAKLPRLGLTTQFGVENLCNIGISPRIGLSNVPADTKTYIVQVTDIDVLFQSPWREAIPATSKTEIPEGGAKTFVGPCIGDNTRFAPVAPNGYTFRVEVLAESAAGRPLAYGWTDVYVQSPYLAARRLRTQQQQGRGLQSGPSQASPAQTQPSPLPEQPLPQENFSPGLAPNPGLLQ